MVTIKGGVGGEHQSPTQRPVTSYAVPCEVKGEWIILDLFLLSDSLPHMKLHNNKHVPLPVEMSPKLKERTAKEREKGSTDLQTNIT